LFLVYLMGLPSETSVIEIDSTNFHTLQEGEWMYELYAPWCGYCKRMEPTWTALGNVLQGSDVKVGRTDGDLHKDLSLRFFISGYPSIFHIKDGQVRAFSGENGRELTDFKRFIDHGWKTVDPYAWYMSPLGLPGTAVSVLGKLAGVVESWSQVWVERGLPLWLIGGLTLVLAIILTVVVTLTIEFFVSFISGRKVTPSVRPKIGKGQNKKD